MIGLPSKFGKLSLRLQALILVVVGCVAASVAVTVSKASRGNAMAENQRKHTASVEPDHFRPTTPQWAMLTVQPVERHEFRTEVRTEGKIANDEDRITRIFSPYGGRITRILAGPGDRIERGQALFVVAAADSVQAQNDFIAAVTGLNKARSQVALAQIVERRLAALYKDKSMPLKDWQEAQANLIAAQNDLRTAEITLQAVRNRLRLLGKSDEEIDTFEKTGVISPDSTVNSPLGGTILQRKVGPGQFIDAGAGGGEPIFLIGDISKVWLVAFVRETDAGKVKLGDTVKFTVLAQPDRVFEGKIDYVASSIDPTSRRLVVRANLDNAQGLLKPEMFANVTIIVTGESSPTTAVPREAVIYEGDKARVWVAREDQTIELRQVRLGLTGQGLVQVLDGLAPGERIITRGSLFIDRIAART